MPDRAHLIELFVDGSGSNKHFHNLARWRGRTGSMSINPTPYTLHPTPHTLHPTPYTLHPTPYTLHPTPYTLDSKP